jgi:nucleotide-binding universal stress UspA family protein
MKKILFATDFSDSSQNALDYLKEMTKGKETKISLIHVFDLPVAVLSTISYRAAEGLFFEKSNACSMRLQEIRAQLNKDTQGELFCIQGAYPSTEIAEIADTYKFDLVVLALRQKYSLIDRMIGTTTAHTIQKADVPVLAIPNGAIFRPVNDILFPTAIHASKEFSEKELEGINWLYKFYTYTDKPKIHMIHIKQSDPDLDITYKNNPFPPLDFIRTKAISVEEGIIKYLESHKVDLMAFYKPNRSYWERLYHSSISRKLLFKSRIPLLIF